MAITNNGTQNLLPAGQIPAGHTRETTTTFTDFEYKRDLTLTILKVTVDEATSTATMTAIFDDATIGLDKQILDIVAATFISSQTVTTYASLTALTTTISDNSSGDGAWLKSTAESYSCTVELFIKSV